MSVLLACLFGLGAEPPDVDYARDVRPLLADRCFACHGPDEEARQPRSSPLRLDVASDARVETQLLQRVRSTDPGERMPPPEAGEALSAAEQALLADWIAAGAPRTEHWAYAAVARPDLPEPAQPGRTLVDRFLASQQAARGVLAAPRADARTRVRRLHFDLWGLPPTPEVVARFEADPSEAAWDALVEELLASPHHAERLTSFWFDLVRFADTTGIHADNRWNIAPYRDWVIEAFAGNMPFDRFTREQLAGDLLPGATRSQQVAAAYNRLNLITREGGSQPKEFLVRYTADRVRNLGEVWLASTVGCAECHDHKFDPLSSREFYELGAFFADIEQVGVYSEGAQNNFAPELEVPTRAQEELRAHQEAELAALESELSSDSAALAEDRVRWQAELRAEEQGWTHFGFLEAATDAGTQLAAQDDGSLLAVGGDAQRDVYRLRLSAPDRSWSGLRLELLEHASMPQGGPGRAGNGNLVLSELELFVGEQRVPIQSARASREQGDYPVARAIDGLIDGGGWALLQAGSSAPAEALFELAAPVAADAEELSLVLHQEHGSLHTLGRLRVSWAESAGAEPVDPALRALFADEPGTASAADEERLRALHRERTPLLAAARARQADLVAARAALQAAIPLVLATRAVDPMTTRVLPRGNWMDESGPVVEPGVPAALGELALGARRATRLDLANWLVARENPLVARVLVNRIWRLFFGRGIVPSLDDFGVQGASPSHPELLDHLASELIEGGWDVRALIREIVRSDAYALASQDGDYELYEHQPRYRFDAELVRDNALSVSGLLVRDVGGPSVRPYQPSGYWAHLNFPRRTYAASSGADLYRRTLYQHWQRQYLHPSLLAFDAPSRERCTAERARSNTPQAALALLNGPIFVEAARVLAARVLDEADEHDAARLTRAWQLVLQRAPRASELVVAAQLLTDHRAHYAAHGDEAARLIGVGDWPRATQHDAAELAAWTSVARLLLNLHETITRS